MNCKFCNAQLEENVTLCPVCGKDNAEQIQEASAITVESVAETAEESVNEITAEEMVEEAVEEPENMEQEPAEETENMEQKPAEEPKQKPKLWLIILAAIGAVALLAVLTCAVLYGIGAVQKNADSYTVTEAQAEKARETVVATVGDVELTNSQLQVFYWQAVEEFYNYYGYYMSSIPLDTEQPLDQQYYNEEEGITWQKYFLDGALSTWSRYAALQMQAKEDGYVLGEDAQAYLDSIPAQLTEIATNNDYATVQDMLQADMGHACDEAGYLDFLYTNLYAGQYLESRYASLIPTMEEIEAYYQENEETLNSQGIVNDGSITTDVRHILVCPQGGTEAEDGSVNYSEAEWEACRQSAQTILDMWNTQGATEEVFAQLAMQYSEDPGSQSAGGLYTDVYLGQMVEPFENWCFDESRQYGDTGLVQTNYGYHVMFFVGSQEIWISSVTDTIVNERSMAIVNDAVAKWPMEANYKKIVLG